MSTPSFHFGNIVTIISTSLLDFAITLYFSNPIPPMTPRVV